MTMFNHEGYTVRHADGRLVADSHVSAHSRRLAVTNSVLAPVPGVPGLHVRLNRHEAAELSASERAAMHDRARAWYAEHFPEVTAQPTVIENEAAPTVPEESGENAIPDRDLALDDLSFEALKERARELDIPGRSKMSKDELAAAIAEAESE